MHPHVANPAAQPHLSLSIFSASAASREERNGGGVEPSFSGAAATSNELRFEQAFAAEKLWGDTVQWVSSASCPVLCSGSRFGAKPAPCGTASFCFPGSSPNKFVNAAKSAAQTSSGPRQECTPWHLGAGPTRSLREG